MAVVTDVWLLEFLYASISSAVRSESLSAHGVEVSQTFERRGTWLNFHYKLPTNDRITNYTMTIMAIINSYSSPINIPLIFHQYPIKIQHGKS